MIAHILLKDLRRFWLETGAFVLITAAWATQTAHPSFWIKEHADSVLLIGFFLIWFFLIVRAVQGESLVGDREFWQTRPYVWWQLLLAKVAFLLLALSLPFSIAQIYLLAASGVHWTPGILPGLIWLQLEFAVFLMLPAAALAALTETIVQWVLTLVVIGLMIPVVGWLPWARLEASLAGTEELATTVGIVIVAAAMIVVITIQYRRRYLLAARIVFAAAVALIPFVVAFGSSNLGRSIAYPMDRGRNPLQFAIARAEAARYVVADSEPSGNNLQIPMGNVSVSPDTVVQVEGMRISLTGQNGWHWVSRWENTSLLFTRTQQPEKLSLTLPSDISAKVAAGVAASRAELAIAVYRMSPEIRIDTRAGRFSIPGNGVCSWPVPNQFVQFEIRTLSCAEPLRGPDLMTIRIESGESTCLMDDEGTRLPPGHYATAAEWDSGPGPADFDPDPVHRFNPGSSFGTWFPAIPDPSQQGTRLTASVCRGTPLHLQTGTFVSRMRITVDLGEVDKDNLHTYSEFLLRK